MLSFNRQILDQFEKNILWNENFHFLAANEISLVYLTKSLKKGMRSRI